LRDWYDLYETKANLKDEHKKIFLNHLIEVKVN